MNGDILVRVPKDKNSFYVSDVKKTNTWTYSIKTNKARQHQHHPGLSLMINCVAIQIVKEKKSRNPLPNVLTVYLHILGLCCSFAKLQ